jgi:hypothetical protein
MSFKNPLTIPKLKMVKPQMYIKTLTAILKNKFKDGETVPFSLILNHIYNGFDQSKSEKLPFFLLGAPRDGETSWKKFRDSNVEKNKKQKDYMLVGTCTRQGDELILNINKSKGVSKLPKKTKTRLEALLKKINKNLTISTTGGSEETSEETTEETATTAAAAGAAASGNDQPKEEDKKQDARSAKKEKAVEQFKEEGQKDAKELSEQLSKLRALFQGKMQVVAKNVEKGATTRSDIKAIKEINSVYSTTMKAYRKTSKQVKKTFEKAYQELEAGKETLYKLSLATKQKKKSLAELAADNYYQNKENRAATKKEVKTIQNMLKRTLQNNRKNLRAPQEKVLKAFSYVLKRVGVKNFKVAYVEEAVEKSILAA